MEGSKRRVWLADLYQHLKINNDSSSDDGDDDDDDDDDMMI